MFQSRASVKSIKIIASDNSVTDISDIFVSINIRESIDIPTINGDITIQDGIGVYEILPIIGQELIEITFENFEQSSVVSGFVYKISHFKRLSPRSSRYVLYFSSYEQFVNQGKNIRRSFKDMTASDIIVDILQNDIQTSKGMVIEATTANINYIAPNITPFKAINQLLKMSVSTNNNNSNYVFFENRHGYIIAPLSSLLHENSQFVYTYGDSVNNDTSNSPLMIEDFESFKYADTLDANTKGMFASQLHTVDLISRHIESYDYTYFDEFDKMSHLNSLPLYKEIEDISDPSMGNQYFNYVDNGMVVDNEQNDYVKSFDPNLLATEPHLMRLRNIIQNSIMDAYVYKIKIPGNIALVPSSVIKVNIPSMGDGGNMDSILSGNVLITSVNHFIASDGLYKQTLETIKDSHMGA